MTVIVDQPYFSPVRQVYARRVYYGHDKPRDHHTSQQDGWVLVHIRGSHHQYKHPDQPGRVIVPHPKRDLPKGTVRSIFKEAGWEWPDQ